MSHFDFRQPPFDVLTPYERELVAKAADIVFFPAGATVLEPTQTAEFLYVVIKGIVREMAEEETVAVFRSNDSFDTRALIAGHSPHRFEVYEEALLFTLPRSLILQLIESNTVFAAFFFQTVAEKFTALAQHRTHNPELQNLLTARVREVTARAPVFLEGEATVLHAAQAMKQHKVKSLLIRQGEQVGIFTVSDFRDVILAGHSADVPLAKLAHFSLICCDIDDYLFNALLTMTHHTVQRVVVTEQGKPVGVLEQIDLLSYFSNHSHLIAQQLERSVSLPALVPVAQQIDKLVHILSGHGVKAPQLAKLVQTLNGQLFARAWALIAPPELIAHSCLVVLGSEGRGEQILKTDQDNALIVADDCPLTMAEITQITQRFSEALDQFGYPPCPGGVMLSREAWCKTVSAWQDTIYEWVNLPREDSQMNLAIFTDAHAVAGDSTLLQQIKTVLTEHLDNSDMFFHHFARSVLQFDTPLGLFGQLLSHEENGVATLDLKKGGIFPLVHGLRALALQYHLSETNSFDRLTVLAQQGHLESQLAQDCNEALSFLLTLRLQQGLTALDVGAPASNLIEPKRLSTLERDLLKEAFAVVKRFKSSIRHHFHLGGM